MSDVGIYQITGSVCTVATNVPPSGNLSGSFKLGSVYVKSRFETMNSPLKNLVTNASSSNLSAYTKNGSFTPISFDSTAHPGGTSLNFAVASSASVTSSLFSTSGPTSIFVLWSTTSGSAVPTLTTNGVASLVTAEFSSSVPAIGGRYETAALWQVYSSASITNGQITVTVPTAADQTMTVYCLKNAAVASPFAHSGSKVATSQSLPYPPGSPTLAANMSVSPLSQSWFIWGGAQATPPNFTDLTHPAGTVIDANASSMYAAHYIVTGSAFETANNGGYGTDFSFVYGQISPNSDAWVGVRSDLDYRYNHGDVTSSHLNDSYTRTGFGPSVYTNITSSGDYNFAGVVGEYLSAKQPVVRSNAYLSGSASIDLAPSTYVVSTSGRRGSISDPTGSALNVWRGATEDLYYGKRSRFNKTIIKHVLTPLDLFSPMPETAPSASYALKPSGGTNGNACSGSWDIIGVLSATMASGTVTSFNVTDWRKYLPTSVTASDSILSTACSGNIISFGAHPPYLSGVNAIAPAFYVTSVTYSAGPDHLTFTVDNSLYPVQLNQYTGSDVGYSKASQPLTASVPISSTVYLASWVPLSNSISGVFRSNCPWSPASVNMTVTDRGFIDDARVWVELIHDDQNPSTDYQDHGLQSLQLAITSPNVNFKYANPLWNDESVSGMIWREDASLTGGLITADPYGVISSTPASYGDFFQRVPEILRNSYLLWDGHAVDAPLSLSLGSGSGPSQFYHEFDRDIGMRTVFTDASIHGNPRDLTALFISASDSSVGNQLPIGTLTSSNYWRTWYKSPSLTAFYDGYVVNSATLGSSLTGANFPWMIDMRISSFVGSTGFVPTVPTHPNDVPDGWLSAVTGGLQSFSVAADQSDLSRGALIARERTGYVYLVGGLQCVYNVGPANTTWTPQSATIYSKYFVGKTAVTFSGTLSATVLPTGVAEFAATNFKGRSSQYDAIYVLGGLTSSWTSPSVATPTTATFIGRFNSDSSITWTNGPALSKAVAGGTAQVVGHMLYLFGGGTGSFTGSRDLMSPSGTCYIQSCSLDINGNFVGSWSNDGEAGLGNLAGYHPSLYRPYVASVEQFTSGTSKVHLIELSLAEVSTSKMRIASASIITTQSSGTDGGNAGYYVGSAFSLGAAQQSVDPAFSLSNDLYLRPLPLFVGTTQLHDVGDPLYSISPYYPNPYTSFDLYTIDSATSSSLNGVTRARIDTSDVGFKAPLMVTEADLAAFMYSGRSISGWDSSHLHSSSFVEASPLYMPGPLINEFNTQGYQLGPADIKPVYPLLDTVFVKKIYDQPAIVSGAHVVPSEKRKIVGIRPGLKGTEINGVWRFMLATAPSSSFSQTRSSYGGGYGYIADRRAGVWLRQVRLELQYSVNRPIDTFIPGTSRKYSKTALVPGREGLRTISIQSGSTSWDIGVNYVQVNTDPEYGRTIGISDDPSARIDDVAVFTRISPSGTLGTEMRLSGTYPPSWFLTTNGYGTPYIPDSSASLGSALDAEQIDVAAAKQIYAETIGQSTSPRSDDLQSLLNREGYSKTTAQRWEETLTVLTASTSATFLQLGPFTVPV